MGRRRIYDPSINAGKTKLPPIEWEQLAIVDTSEEKHGEQPMKKRKKRNSKSVRNDGMNCKELLEAFDRWYAGMKWHRFGMLTFERKEIPLWMAKRAFDAWMNEVLGDDGDLSYRWLRITEYRPAGENLRFHVFVRSSFMTSKYVWMAHWKELVSGEADIAYSFTSKGAKHYLENAVHPDSDFEIEGDYSN